MDFPYSESDTIRVNAEADSFSLDLKGKHIMNGPGSFDLFSYIGASGKQKFWSQVELQRLSQAYALNLGFNASDYEVKDFNSEDAVTLDSASLGMRKEIEN